MSETTSPKYRVEVWDGEGKKVVDFERPGQWDGSLSPKPTLAEFLLARIAEDHAAAFARGADAMTGHRWKHLPEPDYIAIQADWLAQSRRGLAECEAKRRIVSYASTLARVADDEGRRRNGADMLCLLALPYADRPDYREEWKP